MFTYKTVFSAFFKALARYSRNKIWCKNYKGGQKRANLIFIFPLRCIVEYCYVVWHSSITVHQNNALERIQRVCLKIILGKDYVGYISAFESCELETLESRRDKLSLSFAKKCIKSSKHRHLFPASVHPHEHQLPHQEQYYVNHARTEKYRKSAIAHIHRLLNEGGSPEFLK